VTDVTAVVCAYGDQPHLASVVEALRASQGVDVEVVVVDNGSPDCAGITDARIIDPGYNTGFAQGCNLGARHARSPVVVFVNSDAVVDPGCLRRLCDRLADPAVTLVGATIVLADDPETVNSWGNPVHLLGFSWAGGYGLPTSQARSGTRASVSGAVFGVRRRDFLELAGMDEQYFMYGEDVDLSLRAWLAGGRVEVLSDATATHHYDFGRNPDKLGLLERNRLITVLTTYRVRTLLALAPLIVASEAALTLRSRREGWLDQKLGGWRWLAAHRSYLRRRRNRLQGTRRMPDGTLLQHLSVALDPPERFGMAIDPAWQSAIDAYWRTVGLRVAGVPAPTD
jgi:GT2 family glycosyltransferase